jgi:hypothetical protein
VSTYEPQEGALVGRPPCRHCGAAYRLHRLRVAPHPVTGQPAPAPVPAGGSGLACPTAYRPGTLEEAQRELAQAEASGDANRVFVARGNLQRLEGRR